MTGSGSPSPHRGESEFSIASLVRILKTWKRHFLVLALGLPFLTAVLMIFTPNKYTSVGTILVETPDGGVGADLLGQLSSFAGIAGQVPPTEMYLAILRSPRVGMAVADSLKLADYFEIEAEAEGERMEKTLRKMGALVDFSTEDLVTIQIKATDKNPQIAADIVNGFLNELEFATQDLALSRARRTRREVANALRATEAELDSTRRQMQTFQETYGVFSIEKQTEGTLDLIGALQTELLAAQTQREQLEGFTSTSSAQIRNLDLRIQALNAQIQHLVMGETGAVARAAEAQAEELAIRNSKESFFIPLNRIPHLAREYARLYMGMKVQEGKFTVLATQLEQTKIEESQSIPSFDILDRGRRPYKKSGPKRTLYVLVALIAGTLGGFLLVVFLDDLNSRVDESTRREIADLLPGFLARRIRP